MILVYPVGIPALYFALVYLSREDVNPDPLRVLEDCIEGMTGGDSKFELTDEIRALAFYGVELRRIAEDAKKYGEQLAKDINDKAKEDAAAKGMKRQGSMAKLGAYLNVDEVEELDWETAAPGFALAYNKIKLSLDVLDQEMCFRYRAANPDVKGLAFLYEAYEPRCYYFEAVECLRRLALTGLLVFAPDDDVTQVALSCVVAMLAMAVYGGFAPFDKESDDRLFVLSQLVGFVQLFVALLLVTGALGPDYASGGSGMKLRPSLPPRQARSGPTTRAAGSAG